MSDSTFGDDPFSSNRDNEPPRPTATSNYLDKVAEAALAKQEAFRRVAGTLYDLWAALPDISVRQADDYVMLAHQQLMDLAPSLGVSRNGLPELKECCGKKRVWPAGLLQDPSLTLPAGIQSPFREEVLGWWPGDIIRRVSKLFGFKYCEKCDRRRRAINKFFGQRV